MKHFYANGRGTPFSIPILNSNYLSIYNRKSGLVTLLICLFSFHFVCFAQESREGGMTEVNTGLQYAHKPKYNYSLYDAVWSEPLYLKKFYDDAYKRYPKADLYKYPMARYKIDSDKIPWIKEGELLPDEILDLPLWVVNDEYGRDTITLRTEMDKEWIILHSWFESCPPCVNSMARWEKLFKTNGDLFNLIGVFTSFYPHRAAFEAKRFGWSSTQIIGQSMQILQESLARNHNSSGSSIWIKKGRVFGATGSKLSDQDQIMILKGELQEIPQYARWVVRSN